MMLGAAIGALFNGWLSFRLGRKYSLMAGAVLFVAGSIGSAFAASVEVLLVARVVLGVAVGIASYTAPLYLSEMANENVRGKMISMYQLMVTLGIVLAFLSDTAFSYSGNWRAMLGVLALPAVILIILVVFCRTARAGWRRRDAISKRKKCCGCCAIPRKRRATSLTRSVRASS